MKHAMEAPAPGRIPTTLPITQLRKIVGSVSFKSPLESPNLSNFAARPRCVIFASAKIRTCDIENKPIRAQVTLMPL